MSGKVLLGDEAIALGAIHAGLSNAYGYLVHHLLK